MLIDFSLMSLLMLLMHLLRSRVRLVQDLLIPTPILAGFAALASGPQGWDFLPWSREPDGHIALEAYPSQLVVVLFATLYLGSRKDRPAIRDIMRNAGDSYFFNVSIFVGMYGVSLLIGPWLLGTIMNERVAEFSLLLPAAFAGGHGTIAAVGGTLEKLGWHEATSLGYAMATIGLLIGIVGGVALMNIGARLGWARCIESVEQMPDDIRRGFVSPGTERSIGKETVSPIALDPLTWHLAIVLVAVAMGILIDEYSRPYLPEKFTLPRFAMALLMGALLQLTLDGIGLGQHVDRHVIGRIGSCASDYLIAFGIASIKLSILDDYLLPIIIMSAFGLLFSLLYFYYLGPRLFRIFWFERALFVFGWTTGIVATSIMLLRVVDPRFRSRTLEDFGLAYLLIGPVEIATIVFLPPLVAGGSSLVPAVILTAFAIISIMASRKLFGWCRLPAHEMRLEERKMLEEE